MIREILKETGLRPIFGPGLMKIVWLCIAGILILGIKYYFDERENAALRERGIQERAPIVYKETVQRDDGGTSYRLTVRFTPEGSESPVEFRQFVLQHTYDSIKLGDLIEIEYLPEKPGKARLRGEPKELDNPIYIMGILAAMAALFGFLASRLSGPAPQTKLQESPEKKSV